MPIFALLLLCAGLLLLWTALRGARRYGLLTASFWATFLKYPRYRLRRVWPAPVGLGGLILVVAAALFGLQWLLAYYAVRLGHPFSPINP